MVRRRKIQRSLIFILVIAVTLPSCYLTWKVSERHAGTWIPRYLMALVRGPHPDADLAKARHLVLVFTDHHEHPFEAARALASANAWSAAYRKTIEGIRDDYDRPFQYTWFYPYDNGRTAGALLVANQLVFDGLGEIEFHWHNAAVTNALFAQKLQQGVDWFHGIGAMREFAVQGRTAFGYIAGNWALDNGLGTKAGPSRELDALLAAGCYADFTFSNTSASQPSMYSSIYYATDDDGAKSYDVGVPAAVGKQAQGLMIFQGPTAVDFKTFGLEIGAIEAWYGYDWKHRIAMWLKHAPYVADRPEWRFVKLYTHGVQSSELILSEQFRRLLLELKQYSAERNIRLHFVTAREAYNMVRAAEHGKSGDPQDYLDYDIQPPLNRFVHTNAMLRDIEASDSNLKILAPVGEEIEMKATRGPIISLQGQFSELRAEQLSQSISLTIDGVQPVHIVARAPVSARTGIAESIACAPATNANHCYLWKPAMP